MKGLGRRTTEAMMQSVDCCVFMKVVNLISLEQSSEFMTAEVEDEVKAQMNTQNRAKHIAITANYRSVWTRAYK